MRGCEAPTATKYADMDEANRRHVASPVPTPAEDPESSVSSSSGNGGKGRDGRRKRYVPSTPALPFGSVNSEVNFGGGRKGSGSSMPGILLGGWPGMAIFIQAKE